VDAGQQMARNYMTAIPAWFQPYVGGRRLAVGAGLESGSAGGSWGPCLLAIDEPGPNTPTTTVLTTVPLVEYPELLDNSPYARAKRNANYTEVSATTGLPDWTSHALQFPQPVNGVGYWCGTDEIRSCAWIDNGVVSGPIFGGMLGEQNVWYGEPVLPNGITAANGHAKGQNASQYVSYCAIYNPSDLQQVAQGLTPSYSIDPSVVLLPAHPGAVGVAAKFFEDGRDGFVRIARFSLLDKEGVFDHPCRVQVDAEAVFVAQLPQCPHVGHAHRLATRHVHRAGKADVCDLLGPHAVDQRTKLVQIDVSLERMRTGGVVGFIDDHIHEDPSGQLLVQPGGGEVHVAGDVLTRLDQCHPQFQEVLETTHLDDLFNIYATEGEAMQSFS